MIGQTIRRDAQLNPDVAVVGGSRRLILVLRSRVETEPVSAWGNLAIGLVANWFVPLHISPLGFYKLK